MVRCSRAAQQCLGSVAGFDVARLLQPGYGEVAKWFCYIMNSFCLETWAPARARGRSMLKFCYHFSSGTVCEKEEKQSNYTRVHPRCGFHSWNLVGTSNVDFFPSQVLEIAICPGACYSQLVELSNYIIHLIYRFLSSPIS